MEGFTSSSLYRPTRRSALALTRKGELLLITVSQSITMEQFLHIMPALGAWHAVNLDGGSSCAMAYEGRAVTGASRDLPCYILLYHKKKDAPFLNCSDIRKYLERKASIRGRILYLDAYSLFAEKHYAEALEQVLKACELDEHSVTNFDMAARCNECLGRFKEAAHMHIRCAFLLLRQGRRDDARAHIEKALSDNPGSTEAKDAENMIDNSSGISSGLISLMSGNGKKALETLDKILAQGVQNPMVMTLLAEHFRTLGQQMKAAECLKGAAELYMNREAFFQGYLAAKEAVELDPENPGYREILSKAARCKGDEKTAELQKLILQALQDEDDHFSVTGDKDL
jgi:tetratricopeptide (TPR) repeat protein